MLLAETAFQDRCRHGRPLGVASPRTPEKPPLDLPLLSTVFDVHEEQA